MTELVRFIAAADMALLLTCGAAMRASHANAVPHVLDVLALIYGAVFAAVGAGVLANTLSHEPVTPGLWILVSVATPATVAVAVLTAWSLRHR